MTQPQPNLDRYVRQMRGVAQPHEETGRRESLLSLRDPNVFPVIARCKSQGNSRKNIRATP